jgi:hypothetical protein
MAHGFSPMEIAMAAVVEMISVSNPPGFKGSESKGFNFVTDPANGR